MSSQHEVLIRIHVALLQMKTLIETKNCTLKCLKWHYLTVQSMKNVALLMEDGAFSLFLFPPRRIWQLKSPHPWGFAIQGKRNANARGSPQWVGGGWAWHSWNWLMHYIWKIRFVTKQGHPPSSLLFKGHSTEHTTVKRPIEDFVA